MRPGYKQTEVGVIPDDWSVKSVGDVCQILGRIGFRGYTVNDIVKRGQGAIAISPSNIKDGKMNFADCTYISWLKYEESPEIKLCKGDILLVKTGSTFGKTAIIQQLDEKATLNPQLVVLKKVRTSNVFLSYMMGFSTIQNQISEFVVGGALPTLSQRLVANFKIPVPNSDTEQRAIATALSDVDALLAKLDQFIAKKYDLKQAAMQRLLTGQTRLPGFSGEWEVKRLGDITKLYQPVTISAKQFTESGYPVYGANGVVGFYAEFNHEASQVTVTCRGSTCGTINQTVEKSWITGNAMVVNCDHSSNLNKDFLYYLLLGQDLSVCITGTGQPQIVRGPLANFELPIPRNVDEQTAIADILCDMDVEIAALEARRDKTRALKQGMMQELLTGRIRLI